MNATDKVEVAKKLYEIGAIKFGEFLLKSGLISPIYVDMRTLFSAPSLLVQVATCVSETMKQIPSNERELVCGVPYAAVPLATCVSTMTSTPMILCRKEAKTHGLKQLVDGIWNPGQHCVIIEDVITTGSSVATVAQMLRNEGLNVTHALILVDREQGGLEKLMAKWKIRVESYFKLTELADILLDQGLITAVERSRVVSFLASSPAPDLPAPVNPDPPPMTISQLPLEQLVLNKASRLCVAIDVADPNELLRLADLVGPKICALKLHLDIVRGDMEPQRVIDGLRGLAAKHGFLIVEDRKLADIGQTVLGQLTQGIYHLHDWCDLVTVHCLPGPGVLEAFRQVNKDLERSGNSRRIHALVVAQMSSANNLITHEYTAQSLEMCKANTDVIGGFVCQNPLFCPEKPFDPPVPYWVPGVSLSATDDKMGQQYNTPENVFKRFNAGSTPPNLILIVGRGITEAKDVVAAAENYRVASITQS